MKLKVFYHIVDLPGWRAIVDEQLKDLLTSGLLAAAELRLYCYYSQDSFKSMQNQYKDFDNLIWIFPLADPRDVEFPTLQALHAAAHDEDFYALYLHLKGITRLGTAAELPNRHWRWMMNYWTITRWQDCVAKLDEGHDAVGCQIHPTIRPQHFSGNFHWTSSAFIRKCNNLALPSSTGYQAQIPHGGTYRYDPEFWLGWNGANMCSLYNNFVNHYEDEFPPHLYR